MFKKELSKRRNPSIYCPAELTPTNCTRSRPVEEISSSQSGMFSLDKEKGKIEAYVSHGVAEE